MIVSTSANFQLETVSKIISAANEKRVGLIIQVKTGGQATFKFDTSITVDGSALTDGVDITGTIVLDQNVPKGNLFMLGLTNSTVVNITEILEL